MVENPLRTVFYSIERAIKEYRQLVQRNLSAVSDKITVDQALVLMILAENDSLSQRELASILFRDNASMTRTLQLMVGHGWIRQVTNPSDKRSKQLKLMESGEKMLDTISPVVRNNRKQALAGIPVNSQKDLVSTLEKIISNCQDGE